MFLFHFSLHLHENNNSLWSLFLILYTRSPPPNLSETSKGSHLQNKGDACQTKLQMQKKFLVTCAQIDHLCTYLNNWQCGKKRTFRYNFPLFMTPFFSTVSGCQLLCTTATKINFICLILDSFWTFYKILSKTHFRSISSFFFSLAFQSKKY